MPELHPDVAVLAPLLGTWAGTGHGEYPTIPSFDYLEEIAIGHVGKPFLTYSQRTRATDDGRPLHAETGYLRLPAPGRIELVLAQPTGVTEIDEGTLSVEHDGLAIQVASTSIGLTGSAKSITALSRSFGLTGDELTYRVAMAAVDVPLTHHLAATLHRQRG
ncbi:peroxynitrite isomerase [Mycolicibacterium sp. Dal123E01]|uniref:peroxynitrite isomerase n=1 Tax=Mycolicibacterium sp. Dal123E01 TaxID=3457578 RepID=UPI00403EA3C8